jgi:hypothetical protein
MVMNCPLVSVASGLKLLFGFLSSADLPEGCGKLDMKPDFTEHIVIDTVIPTLPAVSMA